MSCVGKSMKYNTSTKTSGGKTITNVNVEETFKYSDGRTETKTRTMTFEGPPPSKEQIVSTAKAALVTTSIKQQRQC